MRLVLEEVFRPPQGEETEPVKMGEIIIYTHELTPEKILAIKNDPQDALGFKKYHQVLKKAGFDIEAEIIE